MTFLNRIVYKYVILFLLLILLLKWQMLVQKNLVQGALCLCACCRLSVNTIERTILTAKEKKVKKDQILWQTMLKEIPHYKDYLVFSANLIGQISHHRDRSFVWGRTFRPIVCHSMSVILMPIYFSLLSFHHHIIVPELLTVFHWKFYFLKRIWVNSSLSLGKSYLGSRNAENSVSEWSVFKISRWNMSPDHPR